MADRSARSEPLVAVDGRAPDTLRTHLRIATCYNLLMREARQRVRSRWRLTWRMTERMLPVHAADIDEIISFMPRPLLAQLNALLGTLRDGLHRRTGGSTEQPRKTGDRRSSLRQ